MQPSPPQAQNNADQNTAIAVDQDVDGNDDVTPMMKGPLHEAFAEQFSDNPEPSEIVTKQPPEPINEQPPEYRPEGDDIQWIPGYWGWDIESDDFIWVSGIWRQVPPDQQWIPGYWAEVEGGWQWISGFWNASQNEEIAYLPPPPASIDNGPSEPAPDDNHFWIAGSWLYANSQYDWQSGYWAPANQDWTWVPDRYVWTPSGYIYRPGYWDYAIVDRGTVFCPVVFRPGYQQVYRPVYCIELGPVWFANLFVLPNRHHYYYGNYYGYSGRNQIYPWVSYNQRTRGYDPLYSYYAYQRGNANWIRQLTRLERQFETAPQANRGRPTVAAYLQDSARLNDPNRMHVASIAAVAQRQDSRFNSAFNYKTLDARASKELQTALDPVRQFTRARAQAEQAANDVDRSRTARVAANNNANVNINADSLKRIKLQSNKLAGNVSAATGIEVQSQSSGRADLDTDVDASNRSDGRPGNRNPSDNAANPDRNRDDNNGNQPRNPNRNDRNPNRNDRDPNRNDGDADRDPTNDANPQTPRNPNTRNPNVGQSTDAGGAPRTGRDPNRNPNRPQNPIDQLQPGSNDPDKKPDRDPQPGALPNNPDRENGLPGNIGNNPNRNNRPGNPSGNNQPSPRDPADRPDANRGKDAPNIPGVTPGNPNRSPNSNPSRNQNPLNQIQEGLNNSPLGQDEMSQLRDQMRGRGNRAPGGGWPALPGQSNPGQANPGQRGQSAPGLSNPAKPNPGQSLPGQPNPGQRGQSIPGLSNPGQPGQRGPGGSGALNPGGANPGQANPGQGNPARNAAPATRQSMPKSPSLPGGASPGGNPLNLNRGGSGGGNPAAPGPGIPGVGGGSPGNSGSKGGDKK